MNLKIITTIVLITASVSLSIFIIGNTFERKIIRYAKDNCIELNRVSCTVKISDVTNFDWDEMHVFSGGEIGDVEKTLGVRPQKSHLLKRKIVFLNNGEIVLFEELHTNLEDAVNNQVYFDQQLGVGYHLYTPETAIFTVEKMIERGYPTTYELESVNWDSSVDD